MTASRETRQTAALVALLQALPPLQLESVLDGLGVPPARQQAVTGRKETRVCKVCGRAYPKCRELWTGDHEFTASPGTPNLDREPLSVRRVQACIRDGCDEAAPRTGHTDTCEAVWVELCLAEAPPEAEPWDPAKEKVTGY